MTISCPKCGSNNISTAGVCANCGWSLFARCVTSSDVYNPIGDMEFEAAGKALLDDYKRLLIENNSLAARIAEFENKLGKCQELNDSYREQIDRLLVTLRDVYNEWITCDDDWLRDEVVELKEKVVCILNDLLEVQE